MPPKKNAKIREQQLSAQKNQEKNAKKKWNLDRTETREKEIRTERMFMRLTPTERVHVEHQASAAGLSISDYLRQRALNYTVPPVHSEVDSQLIGEINRVGCNLHQFLRDDRFGRGTRSEADWNGLYDRLALVLEKAAAAYGS